MEHNRKNKLLMIIAFVMGIASLSVGFAAFSTTLNISSSASVSPDSDTFSIKFSSSANSLLTGAVKPISTSSDLQDVVYGVIDNSGNPTLKNMSVTFTRPGQHLQYIVYVRNEGEYNAYLNGVYYLGDKVCVPDEETSASLVQKACDSIKVTVTIDGREYKETTALTGQVLNVNKSKTVFINLVYEAGGAYSDGPFSVTFPNISLVYSSIDDSSVKPSVVD